MIIIYHNKQNKNITIPVPKIEYLRNFLSLVSSLLGFV